MIFFATDHISEIVDDFKGASGLAPEIKAQVKELKKLTELIHKKIKKLATKYQTDTGHIYDYFINGN